VELERRDETVILTEDEDGNWTMTSPEERPGKADGVREFVGKFAGYSGFKIGEYITGATDMSRYHLDPPPYRLTVKSEDAEETIHITDVILENDEEGQTIRRVYAQWADYPSVVLVMQETRPIEDALETSLTEFAEFPTPTATPEPEGEAGGEEMEEPGIVVPATGAVETGQATEEETGSVAPPPAAATAEGSGGSGSSGG
jgi:hypothetical protein